MKVLFVTNLPSPYRVDFFNELGKKVDLTVCYERRNSSERDEKWVNNSHRSYKEKYIISKNTFWYRMTKNITKASPIHLPLVLSFTVSLIHIILYICQ